MSRCQREASVGVKMSAPAGRKEVGTWLSRVVGWGIRPAEEYFAVPGQFLNIVLAKLKRSVNQLAVFTTFVLDQQYWLAVNPTSMPVVVR